LTAETLSKLARKARLLLCIDRPDEEGRFVGVGFDLSRHNADIDWIIEVFPQIVANLRKLSPYGDSEKNEPRADALSMLERSA